MILCKCPIYLRQTSGVSVCQNFKTPSFSLPKVLGLCVVRRNCFKNPQRFSIGLRSRLSRGVAYQFMWCISKYLSVCELRCFGSLSIWKRCSSGKHSAINGTREAFKISLKRIAFIIPLNITMEAALWADFAPQMWSFAGCLGWGLSFQGCRLFLKHSLLWCCTLIGEYYVTKVFLYPELLFTPHWSFQCVQFSN